MSEPMSDSECRAALRTLAEFARGVALECGSDVSVTEAFEVADAVLAETPRAIVDTWIEESQQRRGYHRTEKLMGVTVESERPFHIVANVLAFTEEMGYGPRDEGDG